jgi:hypothetical protein
MYLYLASPFPFRCTGTWPAHSPFDVLEHGQPIPLSMSWNMVSLFPFRCPGTWPAHFPFTWKRKALRTSFTSDTTRAFQFKAITSQDVRPHINIRTALSIAFANIDCEGFSITPIFILLPYFTLLIISFIVWLHIDYT